MVGLVDCNNFYASCERVFNPSLEKRPIIILSNNDGCVIARSNEAKAIGIAMGAPFYQVKELVEKGEVEVFSSNYNLYGDMSRRVMLLLGDFTPKLEIYSIDEAFLDFSQWKDNEELKEYGYLLTKTIKQGTGIPVTLGIAPTYTLAKMASKYGKKYPAYHNVCMIDTLEKRVKALQKFPIEDVWGIGRKSTKKLKYYGINTAYEFTQKKESWVKRELTIVGVRIWKELQGIPAIDINEAPEKKSICTSRSFPKEGINQPELLEQAVSNFAASCAEKLRRQKSCCQTITVFAYTSRFNLNVPHDSILKVINTKVPTNSSQEIIKLVRQALKENWKGTEYFYKKAGVVISNICPDNAIQTYLFDKIDRKKQQVINETIDKINRKNRHTVIKIASQGFQKGWHLQRDHISQEYTTNIKDVIKVK